MLPDCLKVLSFSLQFTHWCAVRGNSYDPWRWGCSHGMCTCSYKTFKSWK